VVSARGIAARGKPGATVHRDIFPGGVRVSEVFELDQLQAQRVQAGRSYLEFVRVPAMSAGIYVLPVGGNDPQSPHSQDEIYYVISGAAKVRLGKDEQRVEQGSVIFVEAGLEHRFFDIEQELLLFVVFAPAESS
jgi:mannose-6-phosphate isomerase-like protein (cupin superfamily)